MIDGWWCLMMIDDEWWWLIIDDWWLMMIWWLMVDDWWLMVDGWWLMVDGWKWWWWWWWWWWMMMVMMVMMTMCWWWLMVMFWWCYDFAVCKFVCRQHQPGHLITDQIGKTQASQLAEKGELWPGDGFPTKCETIWSPIESPPKKWQTIDWHHKESPCLLFAVYSPSFFEGTLAQFVDLSKDVTGAFISFLTIPSLAVLCWSRRAKVTGQLAVYQRPWLF